MGSMARLHPYLCLYANTKVQLKSALVGGIFAGTIYQLVQLTYIEFQIGP